MPVYIYEATKADQKFKGTLKAPSVQLAGVKLKSRNLEPVYIVEKPAITFFSGGQACKTKDILLFTRQLAFLLSAGVSILRALNIVYTMTDNMTFKNHVSDILKSVEGGDSFSSALRKKPEIFKGFYINMIVCAEETGLIAQTLNDLAIYMEKSEFIKSKVKSAMMYPAVVLAISLSIISGIIVFVVPKFEDIYGGNKDASLPALTQLLVNLSHIIRDNWIIMAVVLIGSIVGLIQYSKTELGKKHISSFVKLLPLFGKLQFQAGLARFCRAFFSLSKSGVNLLEALDIAGNISDHTEIRKSLRQTKLSVSQGKSFAYGLNRSRIFPSLVINMVKVGEESGHIEKSFEKLTAYYEEELENMITGLIKLIEPIMIVVLGGMIGVIVLALYLPVFSLGDVI